MNVILFLILCALQVADVRTTLTFLPLGGKELNPIARWLMEKFGVKPGLIGAKVAAMAIILAGLDYLPGWALLPACMVYVAVVWNNLRLIKRLKAKQ